MSYPKKLFNVLAKKKKEKEAEKWQYCYWSELPFLAKKLIYRILLFDQFTIKISPGNSFFIWFYTEQYFWEVDYVYIQSHTPALAWKQLLKWLYSFLLLFSCIHLLVLGRWSFHWLFSLLKHIPSVQDVFWIWDGWQEKGRIFLSMSSNIDNFL